MDMKETVCKLLLTQIKKTSKKEGIHRGEDCLYSSCTYSTEDMDMSDIAVDFYELIYADILDGKHLLNGRELANPCFAGDSMNSFNTFASMVPEAGKNRETRTPESEWPIFLREYNSQWECLANFWLLPFNIGRKTNRYKEKDSLGIFLANVKDEGDFVREYAEFFSCFNGYEDFCKKSYASCVYDKESLRKLYREKQAEKLVGIAMKDIRDRAEAISNSSKCEDLYEYFKVKKLLP